MNEMHFAELLRLLIVTLTCGVLIGLSLMAWWCLRDTDDEIGYQSKEIRENERKENKAC